MDLAGDGRVTKRIRVAVEGQSVDGRNLSADEIQQMGQSYNPALYGARINCEHVPGYSPEAPFNAYGDVIAVEAVQENGKWVLYNTISALPNLRALNKAGQKIYPSIEFYRDFRGTGKAYQCGLAITDTPALTGTQPIKLSAGRDPYLLQTQPTIFLELPMSTVAQPAAATTPAEMSLIDRMAAFFVGAPSVPAQPGATPAVHMTTQTTPAAGTPVPAAAGTPVPAAADPAQTLFAQMEDRIVDKIIQRLSQQNTPAPAATTLPAATAPAATTVPATTFAAQPAPAATAAPAGDTNQMLTVMMAMMLQQNQALFSALTQQPAGAYAPTVTGANSGLTDC